MPQASLAGLAPFIMKASARLRVAGFQKIKADYDFLPTIAPTKPCAATAVFNGDQTTESLAGDVGSHSARFFVEIIKQAATRAAVAGPQDVKPSRRFPTADAATKPIGLAVVAFNSPNGSQSAKTMVCDIDESAQGSLLLGCDVKWRRISIKGATAMIGACSWIARPSVSICNWRECNDR
jgi:hypothetical protein